MPNGRKYEIKSNKEVEKSIQSINYFQTYKKLDHKVNELIVPHPKKLNYFATLRSMSYIEDYVPVHRSSIIFPTIKVNNKEYDESQLDKIEQFNTVEING